MKLDGGWIMAKVMSLASENSGRHSRGYRLSPRAAALFFRRRSTVDSYLRRLKKPPKFAEIAAENSRDFNPNDFGGNEGQGHCSLNAWIFLLFSIKSGIMS